MSGAAKYLVYHNGKYVGLMTLSEADAFQESHPFGEIRLKKVAA